MVPLEQYGKQFSVFGPLLNKLFYSLYADIDGHLWYKLRRELREELDKESHKFTLKKELEHQCR